MDTYLGTDAAGGLVGQHQEHGLRDLLCQHRFAHLAQGRAMHEAEMEADEFGERGFVAAGGPSLEPFRVVHGGLRFTG